MNSVERGPSFGLIEDKIHVWNQIGNIKATQKVEMDDAYHVKVITVSEGIVATIINFIIALFCKIAAFFGCYQEEVEVNPQDIQENVESLIGCLEPQRRDTSCCIEVLMTEVNQSFPDDRKTHKIAIQLLSKLETVMLKAANGFSRLVDSCEKRGVESSLIQKLKIEQKGLYKEVIKPIARHIMELGKTFQDLQEQHHLKSRKGSLENLVSFSAPSVAKGESTHGMQKPAEAIKELFKGVKNDIKPVKLNEAIEESPLVPTQFSKELPRMTEMQVNRETAYSSRKLHKYNTEAGYRKLQEAFKAANPENGEMLAERVARLLVLGVFEDLYRKVQEFEQVKELNLLCTGGASDQFYLVDVEEKSVFITVKTSFQLLHQDSPSLKSYGSIIVKRVIEIPLEELKIIDLDDPIPGVRVEDTFSDVIWNNDYAKKMTKDFGNS